jgi:hypothetical protein
LNPAVCRSPSVSAGFLYASRSLAATKKASAGRPCQWVYSVAAPSTFRPPAEGSTASRCQTKNHQRWPSWDTAPVGRKEGWRFVVGPVLGTSCKISSVPVGFDGVIAVARKASTLVNGRGRNNCGQPDNCSRSQRRDFLAVIFFIFIAEDAIAREFVNQKTSPPFQTESSHAGQNRFPQGTMN